MARQCHFSGRKTVSGGVIRRRGLAKKYGGVGSRIIAHNKRKFRANLQRVRAVIDGKVQRVWVSAKAIKKGSVVRPAKRRWKPEEAASDAKV